MRGRRPGQRDDHRAPLSPRRATAGDVGRLARTALRAFADDPLVRWLFPDDDGYQAGDGRWFRRPLLTWLAHDELWCTEDGVAFAGWVPPGRPDVTVDEPPVEHPPWRLERFVALRAMLDAHTPDEPHWYLNMLATHPDWQRQGLGGELMSEVVGRADADGLGCYLETETAANVAYYRARGFEVRSEWDVAPGGPHMWGMLRRPR